MKALSIRQPWAWLILHAGKDVENREWSDRYPARREAQYLSGSATAGGGHFLIHAGQGMTRDEYEHALSFAHAVSRLRPFPEGLALPALADLPRGGIVGIARLIGLVHTSASPWFFGPLGLVLKDAAPLPFRPLKGALGFFDTPADFTPHRDLATGTWDWHG